MDFNYIKNISFEAFVVGLSVLIISRILTKLFIINDTNFLIFATGVVVHVLYDLLGLNKYYCNNCLGNC